jgi:hypothetical protein
MMTRYDPDLIAEEQRHWIVTKIWHDVAADTAMEAVEATTMPIHPHDEVLTHLIWTRPYRELREQPATVDPRDAEIARLRAALTYIASPTRMPNDGATLDNCIAQARAALRDADERTRP